MFSPSPALCFVQGAPLRLRSPLRSLDLFGCSRRPLRPMLLPGTNFKSCMMHTRHYPDVKELYPLTVDDYHVLIQTGHLDGQPIELLNGILVRMQSQSPEHAYTVSYLNRVFSRTLGDRALVRDSKPITLAKSNSEPEPDIVIASGVAKDYIYRHPTANDSLLLVEASEATLRRDRIEKLELYASEGIPEYWIADVNGRNVQVFRKPGGNSYESKETFSSGFVAPLAFLDVRIRVEDLFPSRVSKKNASWSVTYDNSSQQGSIG